MLDEIAKLKRKNLDLAKKANGPTLEEFEKARDEWQKDMDDALQRQKEMYDELLAKLGKGGGSKKAKPAAAAAAAAAPVFTDPAVAKAQREADEALRLRDLVGLLGSRQRANE